MPESLHAWDEEWPRNRLGLGQVVGRPGQSSHCTGDRQPLVGSVIRHGDRLDGGRLWFPERTTHPSRTSRLVSRRVHGERMVDEAHSQTHRIERDLWPELEGYVVHARARSEQSLFHARATLADVSGNDQGQCPEHFRLVERKRWLVLQSILPNRTDFGAKRAGMNPNT